MTNNLIVETRNQVAIVTLNRPEVRNAFDDALIADLTRVLLDLEKDDSVRVVVLAGAGSAFCAGADLRWMQRVASYSYEQNLADAQAFANLLKTLDRLSKPTVARVHGGAYGGGVGLVAACDIAIGSHEAEFCLTEVKLGLSPAVISPYVVRAMGARLARRYFLTGEMIESGDAYRLRLLSDIAVKEELDGAINAVLGQLVIGGREAHRHIKDLVSTVSSGPVDEAMIADTAKRIAEIRVSPEGREGIGAFLEKRKPAWVQQFEAVQVKPARKKKK
jgi:methylglutaconyl-CoA hydratase